MASRWAHTQTTGNFVDTVVDVVEDGEPGSRCPVLVLHSDCDGVWTADEAAGLLAELKVIRQRFSERPPRAYASPWQDEVARSLALRPESLADSFIDVDGEPLIDRLTELAHMAVERQLPIVFQ